MPIKLIPLGLTKLQSDTKWFHRVQSTSNAPQRSMALPNIDMLCNSNAKLKSRCFSFAISKESYRLYKTIHHEAYSQKKEYIKIKVDDENAVLNRVIKNYTMTEFTNSFLDHVRISCESFNGQCVWRFSQSNPEIIKIIEQKKESSNGVCEMLAALWTERKSKQASLLAYLMSHTGTLDLNKIRQIQQLHIIGKVLNPGAMIEDKNCLGAIPKRLALHKIKSYLLEKDEMLNFLTSEQAMAILEKANTLLEKESKKRIDADEILDAIFDQEFETLRLTARQNKILLQWLSKNNMMLVQPEQAKATEIWLKAKNITAIYFEEKTNLSEINKNEFIQQMAQSIIKDATLNAQNHYYQLIYIVSSEWGHTIAAEINKEKVALFDPNIGEFQFSKKEDFVAWWPIFLDLAGYSSGKERLSCDCYQMITYIRSFA